MPNTELPMDLESQVVLMKKIYHFSSEKKMREFLLVMQVISEQAVMENFFDTSQCVWK